MKRLNPYLDEESEKEKEAKKQDNQFCLGMESGATNTFKAMVVAEQLVG